MSASAAKTASSIESLQRWLFFGFTALCLVLPSDANHSLTSPKALLFLANGWFFCLLLVRNKSCHLIKWPFFKESSAILLVSMAWLLLSWLWALPSSYLYQSAWGHFKLFAITLFTFTIGAYLLHMRVITTRLLLLTALSANFFYNSLKLLVAALQLFGSFAFTAKLQSYGFRMMTMDIASGVIRMQTSVDLATPFLLFFALHLPRFGIRPKKSLIALYVVISTLSLLLSFSRFLIAAAILAAFLSLFSASIKTKVYAITAFCFIAVCLLAFEPTSMFMQRAWHKRVESKENYTSDKTRQHQIDALSYEIATAPFLGKGLGRCAEKCIRDQLLPYSYEVQWAALTMQLGCIGLFLLLMLAFYVASPLLLLPTDLFKVGALSLYLTLLLSGFTNPYLLSTTTALLYLLFYSVTFPPSLPPRSFPSRKGG